MPVAVFLTETSAPAITAPDASVTVPERVAPVTCARTGTETNKQNTKARNTPNVNTLFFKELPPTFISILLTLFYPPDPLTRLSRLTGPLSGRVHTNP